MARGSWSTGRNPAVTWLGLAWVYSAAIWLYGLFNIAQAGQVVESGAVGVRFVLTIALGIGLCATERWAWAPALCLTGIYTAAGGALGAASMWALASAPAGTLSWQPVFLGMPSAPARQLAAAAALVAVVALANLVLLWRSQHLFEVPDGRPFAVLTRLGPPLTLPVAAADAYLLWSWWQLSRVA